MTLAAPSGPRRWPQRLMQTVREHLVDPFLKTHDRLHRVAWGAAIGTFVGLTPTVGIQMYLVTATWLLARYGLRMRFNLPIALAMVWTSNPVTMLPMYYVFLMTGDWLLGSLGYHVIEMSFTAFRQGVEAYGAGQQLDWLHWLLYAGQVIVIEFGWPMVLGSLCYAVPFAVASYPFTVFTLRRYRTYLAGSQGISYETWRERYETRR
jgi:uncharacterized protein (DUF2062 family)